MSWLERLRRFKGNPVHGKEFRERFRLRRTVWIMTIYLTVIGAVMLGFMYLELMDQSVFVPGEYRDFFIIFSGLQLVMIGFLAPGLSAGAISGERERQTLSILLTTQLSPLSIIGSKLISSLAFIGFLVWMSLPLYSFVFLFGGISPQEVATVFLFFVINIFFFGSLGLFCSTWMKRTGVSTVTAYAVTFLIVAGTGILIYFWAHFAAQLDWDLDHMLSFQLFVSLNPVYAFLTIFEDQLRNETMLKIDPWLIYACFYTAVSLLLIFGSAYLLNPLRRSRRKNDIIKN